MKKFMEEFKAFALRGNVMDMAVGVIIKSFARWCNLHYDSRCRICI